MNNLKLNDVFWTLQGEGEQWGRRALFVRMPYCNLKCSWCDTEFNSHKDWTEEKFREFASEGKAKFAVITGGEPMMNKQTPRIIEILQEMDFEIACESNGTFPILPGIDFATVSPKREAKFSILSSNFNKIHELKLVVDGPDVFGIAKEYEDVLPITTRLSLSPEFNQMEQCVKLITEFLKENPRWRLNLQTHKWLRIP